MGDHRDVAAQAVLGDVGDVLPVDADFAGVEVVEAQQGIDQRRFARAGATDEADFFAGADGEGEVVQHVFFFAFAVAEADVVEFDRAAADFKFARAGFVLHAHRAGEHVHAVGDGADVF